MFEGNLVFDVDQHIAWAQRSRWVTRGGELKYKRSLRAFVKLFKFLPGDMRQLKPIMLKHLKGRNCEYRHAGSLLVFLLYRYTIIYIYIITLCVVACR